MPFPLPLRSTRVILTACALGGLGIGGWFTFEHGKPAQGSEPSRVDESNSNSSLVRVEVTHPTPGGLQRTCIQPGSVEPFDSEDLFAKVSGFLVEQTVERNGKKLDVVDIGTYVKKGDILARISVPEYEKQVKRDEARLRDARAKVKQMDAHIVAAKAEARASDVAVEYARVLVKSKTSFRQYREKQLIRIKELVKADALDQRARDEQEDYYLSALESEHAAIEGVNKAKEQAEAAKAKILQAEADLEEAKAEVGVAEEELAKSKVLLDYTTIRSDYTGVVTKRNFHIGDFIKSPEDGGNIPLLTVERTDLMRVVVQVPDRDVPFVHIGAPASIEIDALPGYVFETRGKTTVGVSRHADAEDPATRTMRTEVDVPNPDGKLKHGMYGRVTLRLGMGAKDALRIPSSALLGKGEHNSGEVRVLRGNKVKILPVRYSTDNGLEAEIISGLSPSDLVILRATGPITDGSTVTVDERTSSDQ